MHKAVLIKGRKTNMIQISKNEPSRASASFLASHRRERRKRLSRKLEDHPIKRSSSTTATETNIISQ